MFKRQTNDPGPETMPKRPMTDFEVTKRRAELHPAAQQAAAMYSHMAEENDKLRAENAQLRHDRDVEAKHADQLRRMLAEEQRQCSHFRNYAIEVRTHLKQIAHMAVAADGRALEFAKSGKMPEANDTGAVEAVEKELSALIGGGIDAASAGAPPIGQQAPIGDEVAEPVRATDQDRPQAPNMSPPDAKPRPASQFPRSYLSRP